MAVDITLAKILVKRALMILEAELVIGGLVYRDYEKDIGKQGKTIQIIKPPTFVANDFDPAVGITVQDPDEDQIEVTLDNWKEVSFQLPDLEKTVAGRDLLTEYMRPAILPLCYAIEQSVLNKMANSITNPASILGSPGSNLVCNGITDTNTQLFKQLCPVRDIANMHAVIGPTAANSLKKDDKMINSFYNGQDGAVLRNNTIPPQQGFDYYETQLIPTSNPVDTSGAVTTAASVGATTIAVNGFTPVLPEGAIVTFAGHATRYIVDKGMTTTSMPLKRGLTAAVGANEIITGLVVEKNLFFHKNAAALAMRPLDPSMEGSGSVCHTETYKGYSMRCEIFRDGNKKRHIVSLDALWAVAMLQPELAALYISSLT